jgi:hypothetical protein
MGADSSVAFILLAYDGRPTYKVKGAHSAIALSVFGVACVMAFGEVSAQSASFTMQAHPRRIFELTRREAVMQLSFPQAAIV